MIRLLFLLILSFGIFPNPAEGQGKIKFYRHPMQPSITSPTPQKDEMGMDFIPVYEGGDFSIEQQQRIGVTFEKIGRRILEDEIRLTGTVQQSRDRIYVEPFGGSISAGQNARIIFEGKDYPGVVIAPDTIKVNASLRPQTLVQVVVSIPLGCRLALPEKALFFTGRKMIVFIKLDATHFEPVSVALGRRAGGYYEIISGLEAGDEVVTSAQFLLDSETRFQGDGR